MNTVTTITTTVVEETVTRLDPLLTVQDLAEIFKMSEEHVKQRIVTQPDFPKPIRLTKNGYPRYKASEVQAFIDSRKEDPYGIN